MSKLLLAIRFARREMRARLSGFRIFFACLVLGVAAIAGVESLSDAFLTGLAEQGRTLLDSCTARQLTPSRRTSRNTAASRKRFRFAAWHTR
jgi:putative ABC transport system permease protein